ncbi:MAG: hypothetical protein ACR2NT_13770 [Acidimicrobiia bacterium]|nr:hypothetical protein [Acidimicrobiia bacterium]
MVNLFAHLGGIDEIGIYVVPVVVALLALRWVEKRAKRAEENDASGDDPAASDVRSEV